jgi:hypothetical protein
MLNRINAKFLNAFGDTREGGRADGSTLAHNRRLALPIGLSSREFRPGHFVQSAFALARLEGLLLHPVPFRSFGGDAAKLFIFLSEEESSIPDGRHLLWREQENWSERGSDSAVQEESRTTQFYWKMGILTRRL